MAFENVAPCKSSQKKNPVNMMKRQSSATISTRSDCLIAIEIHVHPREIVASNQKRFAAACSIVLAHVWPAYFVLLASPEAANSTRVSNELEAWLTERPPENLLIVLSEGTIVWDAFNDDFDWSATTAVPKTLASAFLEAPIWFDLKWANRGVILLPLDPRLRQEVTRLTASLYDRPVEDLFTRDSKRRKRLFWRLRTGIFGLAALLLVSLLVLLFGAILSAQDRRR